MTDALYTTDAYLREFSATVTAVNAEIKTVTLDRTAFYPGGGGQQHDMGELIGVDGVVYPVVKAKKEGGDIVHIVDGSVLPSVGEHVTGKLDWERRYQAMRTHTAMHILCGVIWRDYQVSVTGGNMDFLAARMDFEFAELSREMIAEINEKINAEVRNSRPTQVKILPREEAFQIPDLIRTKINLLPEGIREVRVVEIIGLDLQADGGTHVANTSEIGHIEITDYKSKGAANKRLYVEIKD
ncbi:MAG: alanyl-tRNA editing protein [Anaerolineales bacterium]|nr:alanyl-tRNA editing protein [Anaerolineales bacterium]